MNKIISILLVIVGVIHLLPLSGVLGSEQLSSLYGLSFEENNLTILMRHRAILFGLFGVLFIYAAFNKTYQPFAFIAGVVSTASFIALSWATGNYNAAINNVVIADIVALICIVIAAILSNISKNIQHKY